MIFFLGQKKKSVCFRYPDRPKKFPPTQRNFIQIFGKKIYLAKFRLWRNASWRNAFWRNAYWRNDPKWRRSRDHGASADLFCEISRSFFGDENESARFIGDRWFLPWYFAGIQVCFWCDTLLKGQQMLTRHREDNNVTSALNKEIKFQNKIKFRIDLPSQIFLAMISETQTFFFLALLILPHIFILCLNLISNLK